MTQNDTIQESYFNQLRDKLDELFPKGEYKGRSTALVLNAYANILLGKALEEQKKRIRGEIRDKIVNIASKRREFIEAGYKFRDVDAFTCRLQEDNELLLKVIQLPSLTLEEDNQVKNEKL